MTLKHLLAPSVMAISLSLAACNNAGTDAVKEATTKTAAKVEAVATQLNGTWLKNTEIPADKSSYGAFTKLRDLSDDRVKVIIEEAAAKDAPDGSEEQKIGDFYAAFNGHG